MNATRTRNRRAGPGTVTIGLFGAGRIGRVHAENIALTDGASLVAVHDPDASAATELCLKYGARPSSVTEIMDDEAIRAVMICAPTETHAKLIEQAAAAEKCVFCEKPISLEVDLAMACLEIVERKKGFLMMGFNRRFDPHFAELRAHIQEGAIGDLELVQITSRDPEPPSAKYLSRCGGLFRDMMIHDFDMARFLMQEEVTQISASASALVNAACSETAEVDTAVAILKTASGKLCVITNSRRATYGYDQRIEVHGSLGIVKAGNPRETSVRIADAEGFSSAPLAGSFMQRYASAYRKEAEFFVEAVRSNHVPWPNGRDGLKALQLAIAAEKSVTVGRVVAVG